MEFLVEGLRAVTWQQVVMYLVGFVLIYLAIKKGIRALAAPADGLWSDPCKLTLLRCAGSDVAGWYPVEWNYSMAVPYGNRGLGSDADPAVYRHRSHDRFRAAAH